eukprot:TRINITY_DN24242_c0_g1_i1.p1 TRINITY_DN24242_c0_g1~~TRINITY_DN24242_c0_g1_i1.p1  ORF type:complete len:264 (+),score=35.83 TRINITY_DN24242_c0_g1_i1:62-793(+)
MGNLSEFPVASRLHPPTDPTSRFDPTFEGTGWGHKRLLHPKSSEIAKDPLGKKTYNSTSCETERILKNDIPCRGNQEKSGMNETRFLKGFTRRRVENEKPQQVDEGTQRRREANAAIRKECLANAGMKGGCNAITGGPPIAGTWIDYSPAKPQLKPRHVIELENTSPDSTLRQQQKLERSIRRKERLQLNGQPPERQSWGVKDQLASYDGYCLPAEVAKELASVPPRAGRRALPAPHQNESIF